ncbi:MULTISPECIES: hypothetical protein [unclassified Pseudonocardia]|uniref:hypothetical protein n=1 Tax=unclassified Pseudonocardia TaxID=2619320 RepID=UPI00095FD726|nr:MULTISPECIES: hypothetical protein [unclassified Pseudonocardia]OLL72033.1 hypothetical protein Ae150APs1_0411c [Pseudonocardia sp. Ae150A_Ps1]OLM18641.1 hypothetical protein Ae707Ps1_2900c [Pseudonocardia sp. Ae707_Ps1]
MADDLSEDIDEGAVNAHHVAAIAALAGLPLEPSRLAPVAALLSAWIPGANALSARMQSAELDGLMPAVVFTRPGIHDEEGGQ